MACSADAEGAMGWLPAGDRVLGNQSAGERIHVVHNWSWTPVQLTLPHEMTDVLDPGASPMRDLELGPGTSASRRMKCPERTG